MSEGNPIRIALLDDHPMVRQGLAALLGGEGFDVVATAAEGHQVLELVAKLMPDLLVVDLTLEHGSGLEIIRIVAKLFPAVKTVVYSVHEDGDRVRQAVQAGAMGYVTKREDPDVLLLALSEVLKGDRFLSPRAASAMADSVAVGPTRNPKEVLSSQELEVFSQTGKGHTAQDVAERMGLSVRTVETYYGRILDKLELRGRKDLRLHASEWVRKEGS